MYYKEWVMFFDDFAGDFHPTFMEKLNLQLYEKGSTGTGIKKFEKYGFQLVVGMNDLQLKVNNNRVYAKINFITPTSWSFPVDIYWRLETDDEISTIHQTDVSDKMLEVNWAENFPIKEILPHIQPYRIDKKEKTNFSFDVEYYYFLLPDISLQLKFSSPIFKTTVDILNQFFKNFSRDWNQVKTGKEIQYMSEIIEEDGNQYYVLIDIGLKNNIHLVTELLKELSLKIDKSGLTKVTIR